MRALLLIVLGFAAGLAVGLLWRESPEQVRRPVRTVTELPGVRRAPPEPEEKPVEAPAASDEVAPTGGVGFLEFDGRVDGDVREGWIGFRNMYGLEDALEPDSSEGGLQRWRLRAGIHRLCWWHGPRDDLRVVEVRIEPGEVTRVVAASPVAPDQFPIAHGLGRIDVEVFDLENRPAPQATVEFECVGPSGETVTDEENCASDGSLRLDLVPGDYTVRVGCQAQPARVVEGQTLRMTFRSRNEGEVRFVGGRYAHIVPTFESKSPTHAYAREANNKDDRYIYVRPGLYEAKLAFPGDLKSRVLGRVDVAPGVISEFTTDPLPTANVEVRVRAPEGVYPHPANIELTPLDPGAQPSRWRLKQSFDVRWACATARHVSPGIWRLRVHADPCDTVTRTIEVGHESQEVEVVLQRSTIR